MNFIDVKLVEKDGEIYAQNDALSIKLNAGDCGALTSNGYIGKEVILGIIPEDIHIEDIFVDNSLDSTFEANVELGELMGAEIYAYLKAGNHSIIARFDGRYKLNIGDKLTLNVINIYEDDKLGLSPRQSRKEELDILEKSIMNYLEGADGHMRFNDKSTPEELVTVFNTSKKNFKRALGVLMKKDLIYQNENGTYLK